MARAQSAQTETAVQGHDLVCNGTGRTGDRKAHNPKVVGSNPTPATIAEALVRRHFWPGLRRVLRAASPATSTGRGGWSPKLRVHRTAQLQTRWTARTLPTNTGSNTATTTAQTATRRPGRASDLGVDEPVHGLTTSVVSSLTRGARDLRPYRFSRAAPEWAQLDGLHLKTRGETLLITVTQ